MEWARIRIRISWAFAAMGAVIGLAVVSAGTESEHTNTLLIAPMAAVLGAYILWSLYWGLPPVWRWWCELFRNAGCFVFTTPIGWLFLLILFFYIPFVGGAMYGAYGGAIYEFLKCRRLAKGLNPNFTSSPHGEPSLEELMADAEAMRSYSASVTQESQGQSSTRKSATQEEVEDYDSEITPQAARSILAVGEMASREEIHTAFREQMKKYHPDRVAHLGHEFRKIAEEKAKLINRAYEVLKTC